MNLSEIIKSRRSYRSLAPAEITEDLIRELSEYAGLSPSCYNHQPWRYVFVYEKHMLEKLFSALSKGNSWAKSASMIIAVFSNASLDCMLPDERNYYQFDTGISTGFLILKANENGLVAHPIAGYDEKTAKDILCIPEDMRIITLVIVGKHGDVNGEMLNEKQIEIEKKRPERNALDKFVYLNSYDNPLS